MNCRANKLSVFCCFLLCTIFSAGYTNTSSAQLDDPFSPAPAARQAKPKEQKQQEKEEEGEEEKQEETPEVVDIDTAKTSSRRPQYPDKYVRFHMWDGSIIGGEVESNSIDVETDFGPLVIPIKRVRRLYPGLQSLPELNSQIDTLVAGLGDRDFDVREKSQQALVAMGVQIRTALDEVDNGGSAERKKRLGEVITALDELMEELEEGDEGSQQPLVTGDTVETPDFSIVGKIRNESFKVKNKFGLLTIQLGDIKVAERGVEKDPDSIRKTVSVEGATFFQKEPVSAGIRVHPGDRIKIDADGMVRWTNWNRTSSPNGITNYGSYNGVNCGTLCAKVGKNGTMQKIGKETEFVVKKTGVLYFAIAMKDSYANSDSYKWSGAYNVHIRVFPAEK